MKMWRMMVLAVLVAAWMAPASVSAQPFTVAGDVNCDNQLAIYTAPSESGPVNLTYTGFQKCYSATPLPVSFTTNDRYLYIVCWSDDGVAQGLLHDLTVNGVPVYSGNPAWGVAPADSNLFACLNPAPIAAVQSATAARIPTAVWGPPANGCFNPPSGTCYGVWGSFATISFSARWTWFDSGAQVSTNAPFQPGFNHREFLIFRLDMLEFIATPAVPTSWGTVKHTYR